MDDVLDLLASLTPQEQRVARLVGTGTSNKAAARSLGLTIRTVEFHLSNTYRKLGISSRTELAHLAGRWVSLPHRVANAPTVPALVGRQLEIDQISASLAVHRLVTLRGPGGVGKTSLAIAACAPLADGYADGAFFVDLAAVRRPEDVVAATCAALGLRPTVVPRGPAVVADALGIQQRLVILDNCEHVLDAAGPIAEAIVHHCPHTAVLTTSRQRLDRTGEHVVAVGPLSLTSSDGPSAAVQLFVQRARDVDGEFTPSSTDVEVIESICARLDGLPLAIELAASRAFALGLDELERRLGDALDVVARQEPGGDRHRSLRTTIDWSYQLLTPDEQASLAALSVFAGDVDLSAAIAVAPPGRAADTIADDVAGLVEASVVTVVDTGGQRPHAGPRDDPVVCG